MSTLTLGFYWTDGFHVNWNLSFISNTGSQQHRTGFTTNALYDSNQDAKEVLKPGSDMMLKSVKPTIHNKLKNLLRLFASNSRGIFGAQNQPRKQNKVWENCQICCVGSVFWFLWSNQAAGTVFYELLMSVMSFRYITLKGVTKPRNSPSRWQSPPPRWRPWSPTRDRHTDSF